MATPKPRFTATDFSQAPVVEWTPDHIACGRGFKCGVRVFASHFMKRVPRDVAANVGRCWVIVENGNLAGYITLMSDKLVMLQSDGESNKPLLADEGIEYTSFPAIKVGLLAADHRAKGAG